MKVILFFLALCISTISQAATYYISPTGNDATGNGTAANPWRTLAKATSTVTAAGNIIHVTAGTYTETQQLNLAVGVSIEGEGAATTIINSTVTGQWSLFLSLDSPQDTNGNQSISGVTFDGGYVSESNNKTWWGIVVGGRSNVSIHDTRIINFRDRGVIFDGNDANDPLSDPGHYATGNKFYNNTILNSAANDGNYGRGLLNIGGQLGMEIYNNTLIQDQRVAFRNGWPIKYWDNGWLKGVKITNNTLTKKAYGGSYPGEGGDWDFAIELFNVFGLEIGNNTIQGSIDLNYNRKGTYAYCAWIHHNFLNHATLNPNFESGIILEFATESIIIENNILNNVCDGVSFNTRGVNDTGGYTPLVPPPPGGYSYISNCIIRNNLFSNLYQGNGVGTAGGILVISEGTDDPQISNLQIYNNTIVAKAGDAPWIGLDFTSQPNGNANGLYIRNNIVNGFADSWLKGSNGNTNIANAVVTHNNATGNGNNNLPNWPAGNPTSYTYNNNLAVNPLFVSTTNFTLQATSPVIDKGINIGLPYSGAAPDMGYAEYASGGNATPTANAGADQTITLPTSTVNLAGSGTDPDGTIATYAWTKISGPTAGTITNPAAAATSVTALVAGVYRFELRVTDNNGATDTDTMQVTVNAAANIAPTANAGLDQSITLPTNTANLSGSGTDVDGTIATYAWTKVSGPTAGTITNPAAAATSVTALVAGVYRFELRVTDNNGASDTDTMQVTVNAAANIAPTANAGTDQSITLPTNAVILSGNGTDIDGIVTNYNWTKVSGPAAGTITNPTTAATSVTGLVAGVYRFELRVTDNNGATDTDTMQVTVNVAANIAPTANAGADQSITLPTNSVILSGSGTDVDGTITAYAWTKISGPAAGTITNPTTAATSVTALVAGVYRFELRVTDNNGATDTDTMQVTVNVAGNIAPTANAGADQSITLPTNSVILSGSGTDVDGTITVYAWTKISGPAAGTITNPTTAATSVTALTAGVYRFELTVTDNNGATDTDTMQVTVNVAGNIAPTANAGADQTITLPTNSVILSGSGTDADGTITAYAWTKISGPAAGTITNPNTAATAVTALAAGIYRFELTVTDNNGATDTDTMQVTVNAAAGNIAPTANAGTDQSITLPTNSVILSGSGTDVDGTITAYAWTKISGPTAGTITNSTTAATSVTGLVAGIYRFELRVTDNNGATDTDTMQVTVNVAGNIAPIANAGADQSITLPTTIANLLGSGIDPDGTITAYTWTKISGPAAGTITNPTTAATSVIGLVTGFYRFELRVTDNNGATDTDTMQVTVNAAANIAPIANAGADQTITLPTNTVILSGNGTDPDGTITAYTWTKISGPAAGTITNPNVAATFVTGLVTGVYRFELRVTDNNGATDTDTIQVTVNAAVANIVPVANAGIDQSITLPTNSVILSGSGADADGTITSYAWTKVSGPAAGTITNPASAATSVTGMVAGVYRFELRVTDNSGGIGTDTMQVTVNAATGNIAPNANAGADQSITLPTNTVILSGNGTDADGTITAYAWTKISGPVSGIITNPGTAATSVTALAAGIYRFELTVTDNNGATDTDTVQVTVNAAAGNIAPTANAGVDQSITLPTNTVILSGSGTDADGTITAYAWTKISGPANGTITNPTTAATSVTGLVAGVYRFELRVTDNNGATDTDTIQVTVNSIASNVPPTAIAGVDQSITLPTNSVILSGSGTDADGTITAYAWTKISGPANGTITNPTTAATSVTGLVAGVYRFELRVTDNNGASDTDTMQVTVNPAATNIPPTANAGVDQSITLPTNSVILSGSGTDVDGTITAYTWTKISGPANGTITNPTTAATSVTGLVAGVYRFELRVTDNNGATDTDTMQVTVNVATNIAPTANAGTDQNITLPTNSVILSGSGTDVDGTITAYAWTKISGPAAGTITNPTTAATSVTGLVAGIYRFELRVTDNNGATDTDTVQVIVFAPNITPTANAGLDQSITLPTNSTNLLGSGNDPDGTIIAYSWSKISGPTAGSITNPTTAASSITGLVAGVYKFELRVTDNNGASDTDTMQVTVNPDNIAPTANAGPDQTVILPANNVTLNGSGIDVDGTITAYAWRQIGGPADKLTSINTATTVLQNLVDGTYQFELTVTDNKGATGKDTVSIIAKQEIAPSQNSINVYPNPVIDFTTLEINTTNNKSGMLIVVTDLQGRNVYTKQIPAGRYNIKERINMSSFAKSMYLITVHFSSQDKQTIKALKN
jgi:PKD domain/Secretion system C-terminal sorting domain